MNESNQQLDGLHHVACVVRDVAEAAAWYQERFRCQVAYEDETWALLRFANASLALVTEGDHPAHVGFVTPAALDFGPLITHRDGTRSVYVTDPSGNSVELLDPSSG